MQVLVADIDGKNAEAVVAEIAEAGGTALAARVDATNREPLARCEENRYHLALFEVERARALAGIGEGEQAGAVAHRAAALLEDAAPTAAGRAYGVVAAVFRQLGDSARAREVYELAAERLGPDDPFHAEIHTALGELWEAEGNTAEALAAYKRAAAAQARTAAG